MSLPTQSICNQISLPRMIFYVQIIILDQLQPSTLSQVKILLSEDVHQSLVISVNLALGSHDVMPPDFPSMNHSCQLEIMCRIVLLMLPQLPRCVSYNMCLLHKNTNQTLSRRITIDIKGLLQVWHHKHWSGSQPPLQLLKTVLTCLCPLELPIFH
jgi:hypothetical protein